MKWKMNWGKVARVLGIVLASYLVGMVAVAHVLLFWDRLESPAPVPSVTDPFGHLDLTTLPPIERYAARDGAQLSYRTYRGSNGQAAILIHGSAGSSSDMHPLALALQKAGVTVFVPDLRGHGANLPHGNISYMGQLDDDMGDFLTAVQPRYPGARWTLLGFSSGGGFVLRIAGGDLGARVDRYLLLSPYLRYNAPTIRPTTPAEGNKPAPVWCNVDLKRIIGLSILGSFGIHVWDGLPVLAFPVPANSEFTTATYSFRLEENFEPHADYLGDIGRVSKPMEVLVGSEDELFLPEKFAQVFDAKRGDIPVTILPGLGHIDMIMKAAAIDAVVARFGTGER